MKKKIYGLVIFLLGICAPYALAKASVQPLSFGAGFSADQQEAQWDSLMKYKLWGTEYINTRERITIDDTIGYNGTKGWFYTMNDNFHLGGPILVGGDMTFENAAKDILVGSVRVEGNLQVPKRDAENVMRGGWCVKGSIKDQYNDGSLAAWNNTLNGHLFTNETNAALTKKIGDYASCPDSIPPLEDLSVPVLTNSNWDGTETFYMTSTDQNEVKYIHVPPDSVETNAYGTYDKYLNEIVVGSSTGKVLYVLMPPGGKLTRIFSKNGFSFNPSANDFKIQVVYVKEGTEFKNGAWDLTNSNEFTYVSNKEYSGNLLFYTNNDIQWNYWVSASFQGTWMTTGKMVVAGHFKLAGQVIANQLEIMNDVNGDFKYMPFDPPWIDINPEARSWGTVYEGVSGPQPLSIVLNEPPTTDVSFKYCFVFDGDQANNKDTDPDSLNAWASLADVVTSAIPVCNGTSVYETVEFPKGHTVPTKTVTVSVQNDLVEEWTEFFKIRVFDMVGAVLPDKTREGEFLIEIDDDDKAPKGKDTVFVGVEDTESPFVKFPATTGNGADLDEFQVKIESLPMKNGNVVGTLIFDGTVVDADAIAAGLIISSEDIGKLVYLGEENAFGDNKASFTYRIISKDVSAVAANTVTINLQAVNDKPIAHDTVYTINENVAAGTAAKGKIRMEDVDDTQFTYAFDTNDPKYTTVNSIFAIDATTGAITVKNAGLDYEALNADTTMVIKVIVTDAAITTSGSGKLADTSDVTIKVVDVNEAPVVRDTAFTVDENVPAGTEVGTLEASDPDIRNSDFGTLYLSIDENADGNPATNVPFAIDNDGKITVTADDALDFETKPTWVIHVTVTDGFIPQTVEVVINLNDLNEPPHIDDILDQYNVVENSANGTPVTSPSIKITDPDAGDGQSTLSAKIEGFTASDKIAEQLFKATVATAEDGSLRIMIAVERSDLLDYEALLADGADTVSYDIRLILTDREGGTGSFADTAFTTIYVTDENERPTAEDGEFTIAENSDAGTVVGQVVASDPDTAHAAYGTLYYSFMTETTQFVIDQATGVIRVAEGAVLDYETTPDHKITLLVAVTDNEYTETATVTVTLTEVNENPEIVCIAGDDNCNGPFKINENSPQATVIHSFAISDVDAGDVGRLTATLSDNGTTGADSLFTVVVNDAQTMVSIVLIDSARLDFEKINATHEVVITVVDGSGLTDTLIREIQVNDVNEAPVIANKNFTPDENIENDELVGEMTVKEPDSKNVEFRHLDFSIIESVPFYMDSNKVKVGDASLLDFETTPEYTFRVVVKNCEKNASTGNYTERCLADTADVKVTLQNVNEDPEIKCIVGDTKCNGPFEIDENSKTGTEIHTFAITDVDANDAGKLTVALTDSVPGGIAATLFDVKLNDDHTEVTVVVKDSAKLNYEAVDSSYVVVLTVKDVGGKTDTLIRTINIRDVNEKPTIADKSVKQPENFPKDSVIAEVSATDPDTKHVDDYGHLDYSIITPDMPFYMDSNKVKVADSTKIDFETTPVFTFKVKVENCEKNASTGRYTERCLADTATVKITLTNVNENPEIKCIVGDTRCNGPFEIDENSKTGTEIHTFAITDVDANDAGKLTVALTDSVPGGIAATLFDVKLNDDHTEVTVVVKDSAKLNYEAVDSSYVVVLTVKDVGGKTDTLIRTINIRDVNEKPTIADKSVKQPENFPKDSVIAEVSATDPDTKHVDDYGHLDYSIITPDMPFYMDSNKVRVGDSTKLDFETTPVFTFKVEVKNCEKNASTGRYTDRCLADTATVVIELKDVNETPKIIIDDDDDGDDDTDSLCVAFCDTTSRGHTDDSTLTVFINENSADGAKVFAYVVSDEDAGDLANLTPSLKDNNGTGVDSLFKAAIVVEGGKTKLAVIVPDGSKLDFEKVKPLHEVTVYVTDPDGLQDSIVRRIQVIDVNEAPTVEDAVFAVEENSKKGDSVGVVVASDPDVLNPEFGTLYYSLLDSTEGAASKFNIDNTGKITVAENAGLNYEQDSVFYVKVRVTDSTLSDTALVTIKLKDTDETPKIIVDDDDDGDDDTDTLCIAHCDTTNRGSGDEHGKNILTVGVNENSPTGTVVMEYFVYDEDADDVDSLVPSLGLIGTNVTTGVTVDDIFEINKVKDGDRWKIVVKVKDSDLLNYEELRAAQSSSDPEPQYTVAVIVSEPDGHKAELKDTIIRVIEIRDMNESPLFTVETCEIAENNQIGDSLGRVEHPSDIDSMSRIVDYYDNRFKLVGGDTALFDLRYDEPIDGRPNITLVAKVVFDCESEPYKDKCGLDSAFHVVIDYFDKNDTTIKMTKDVPIKLIDVNEKPKITTDSVDVKENVEKGTVVDTIKATDPDVYDSVLTYTLVEDKSGCFEVSERGVITVKVDNCPALDYEKNHELPITVKVTDNGTDGEGDNTLSDTKTIIVKITDVNEKPDIPDQTITVSEDAKIGTEVGEIEATDPDTSKAYGTLTYELVEESETFEVKEDGTIILKDSLDYEKDSIYTIKVRVTDSELSDTATVTIKIGNVIETPEVEITIAETVDSTWKSPDTLYINTTDLCVEWEARNKKSGATLKDTTECMLLEEGENIIVKKFEDPSMDFPGYDTLVVYVSKATPIVSIRKAEDDASVPNIFTVVEESAQADTAFYVNERKNDIIVTVTDPESGSKETFTTKIELDTVSVPKKTFTGTMSEITDFSLALTDNPSSGTSRTPVNGEKVAVSYTEVVNGHTVTVTYYTDDKGEMIANADGVVEMTVAYKDTIGGHEVTISYQADAVTGAVIKTSGGYAKPEDSAIESSSSGKGVSSSSGKDDKSSSSKGGDKKFENEVVYTVSYETVDEAGNAMTVSYGVDAEGNIVRNEDGNIGYLLTYTYKNKFGNTGTQSLFIVLDQVPPKVKILYPTEGEVIYSNFVDVKWTVDIGDGKGPIVQDTLVTQSLNKGGNVIVRFYRDKAGNEASDTIRVIMKNAKDVDIAIEKPVTEVTQDLVAEYYATHEPEDNQTFAVTIYNPKTDKEVETVIGGGFDNKPGTGDEPYPGLTGHLGPTLGIETKVPTVNAVGGLATLDDIIGKDGLVPLEGVEANSSKKVSVEEYVRDYCTDEFAENVGSDLSRVNLYKTKMYVKVWIYTTLGDFVDYYTFTQELDNPDYMSDAGLLTLYFEMKPDRDGNVRTASGRLLGTGAYVYRTEVEMKSTLRCSVPPFTQNAKGGWEPEKPSNKVGSARSVKEDMLKNFGYKRPEKK